MIETNSKKNLLFAFEIIEYIHCIMRQEWILFLMTTVEAVNIPKRKQILNIYSVTVQHTIERGMICWETTFLVTYPILWLLIEGPS